MARLRTIKPGFFTDDELGELPPLARLLYAGLWCQADREGRLEDRPKKIKVEVLPYDTCNVDTLLAQLADRGLIWRYEVGGKRYIAIPTFGKHQNPHIKEAASTIPPPQPADAPSILVADEHQESTGPAPDEHSSFRAGMGSGVWGAGSGLESMSGDSPTPTATGSLAPAPLGASLVGPHGKPLDVLWEALVGVFGEPLLEDERNNLNGIVRRFRSAAQKNHKPEEHVAALIRQAAANWSNVMGATTITPNGLAKHFTTLTAGPQVNGRHAGTVTKHQQTITQSALVTVQPEVGDVMRDRRERRALRDAPN